MLLCTAVGSVAVHLFLVPWCVSFGASVALFDVVYFLHFLAGSVPNLSLNGT